MSKIVIIGDSHLKININQLARPATVVACGDLRADRLSFQFLSQYEDYDVCFFLVGENDVSYHEFYNAAPKTPTQTANHLISCQINIPNSIISL